LTGLPHNRVLCPHIFCSDPYQPELCSFPYKGQDARYVRLVRGAPGLISGPPFPPLAIQVERGTYFCILTPSPCK
jgi:hypothetical protein